MSKVLLFVLTVTYLSLSTVLSQDNFVAISIEWQLGDKKKVTTVSSEIMLMNGVEILNTSSTGVYTIEVVDTVDFFTLVYQQKKTDIDFNLSLSQDTSNREITEYIHQLIELTSDVSYTIRVDKDTGEPIEVLNEDEIIEQIKGITKKILPKLELDTTDSMFSSFNETVMDEVVGSVHSQIMQTILNSCNIVF